MSRKLFVGNLAYSATEADLRGVFGEVGEVASVKVVLDRDTGRPRGFAFIEMADDATAAQAIERLNGQDVQGRPIAVREAEDRRPGGGFGGGGGGGGGFGGPRRDFGGGGGGGGGDRGDRGGRRQRW